MSTSMHGDDYLDELEAKAKRLTGHIKLLRLVLISCEEKLEIYRDHSGGRYHGGTEHTSLIGRIKTALAVTEDEDE